jgi:hypothetical protein
VIFYELIIFLSEFIFFIVCKWRRHVLELPCSKTKMTQMKEY